MFTILLFSFALATPSGSLNLLKNCGFELGPQRPAVVREWTLSPPKGGVFVGRAKNEAFAGNWCATLKVEPNTAKAWYGLHQELLPGPVGRSYTLSVYVRTHDVRDGAGAYCSITCLDGSGRRLTYFDSPQRLTGTTEWTRITTTGNVVKGTARLKVSIVLHGYGEAFFDNIQLEVGKTASKFKISTADIESAHRAAVHRTEAAAYAKQVGLMRHAGHDIVILKDNFPSAPGHSSPNTIADALRRAGYHIYFLNGEQLANPALLDRAYFDLLVLPYGPCFPAAAWRSIVNFLANGGHFISMGGYAFDKPLVRYKSRWYAPDQLPKIPTENDVLVESFDNESESSWFRGGMADEKPRVQSDRNSKVEGMASLHVTVPRMFKWASVTRRIDLHHAPKGWSVTKFRARGNRATTRLHVEWQERDKSRWTVTINLSEEWKEYSLYVSDFKYWRDNPSVGRGGERDHFQPENAEVILFGISETILPNNGRYEFWIDDLHVAKDPLKDLRLEGSCSSLNTRTARIRDAMWPTAEQIGVFDPSHPLERALRARAAANQFIFPQGFTLGGPFEGYAAVAVLGMNGHGFGPNLRRLVPLLESQDRFGRTRGALGSLVFNYAGYYAPSSWAFFGVTNRDLFSAKNPEFLAALPKIADTLLRGLFLHDTAPQYACYQPTEIVKLQTKVENRTSKMAEVEIIFDITVHETSRKVNSIQKSIKIAPSSTAEVVAEWTPNGEADLYEITAHLIERGVEIDREKSGVVVWNEAVARAGPRVAIRNGYFEINGRPRFLFGTQNWWGQVGAITARSPLLMDRDFRIMSNRGMRMSRCFLAFRSEEERRVSDAWVYLAQKHGIVIYHTPNLFNTISPEELKRQAAIATEIAKRYRHVPGIIIDICNEPAFHVTSQSNFFNTSFRAWLKGRYKTDAALKQVWGDDASLKTAALNLETKKWDDARGIDTCRFLADAQREWADNAMNAFKAGRSDLAISVGWSQGWGWGINYFKDPGLTCLNHDFTDDHYYGYPEHFIEHVKMTDRRFAGKPWTLGECGGKNHPAYYSNLAWGQPQPEYNDRFAYLGHHCLGLGMSFMLSWHLRDPMEGIFPCGLIHADYATREALSIVRNMSIMFSNLQPRQRELSLFLLLPDSHRHGIGRDDVHTALIQLFARLYGLQVDYGILHEEDVASLPPSAKTIIYPIPYCPSDEVIAKLNEWVRSGRWLYLSGDISYNPQRHRTRKERLESLCGVRWLGDNYEGAAFSSASVRDVLPTKELKSVPVYRGRPGLRLAVSTAEVLAVSDCGPVILESQLGRGHIFFVAEPVELETTTKVPCREILRAFLERSGVKRAAVEPHGPSVRAFEVPLVDGGAAYIIFDDDTPGVHRWKTSNRQVEFGLRKREPGMVVINRHNNITLAEAQQYVSFAKKQILKTTCHVAVIALDDQDIRESRALLVLPFAEEGSIEIASALSTKPYRAELGEVLNSRWHTLARADVRREVGRLTFTFDSESRLEMLLIAAEDQFDNATSIVVGRTALSR